MLLGLYSGTEVVELPGGVIELSLPTPVSVLVRIDAEGAPLWSREVTKGEEDGGLPVVTGVGEDGQGKILALTGGAYQTVWDDTLVQSNSSDSHGAAAFDPVGNLLWATELRGIVEYARAVPSRSMGHFVSGGAAGMLAVGPDEVAYDSEPTGPAWNPNVKGIALRLDGGGPRASAVTLGVGAHSLAAGPEPMFAASRFQYGPLALSWCSTGTTPCDQYVLADTVTSGLLVAVTASGAAAYLVGEYQPTVNDSAIESPRFFVMRLEH